MERNRDLVGRRWERWIRRALLCVLLAVCLLGVANVFGQRPGTATSATDRAQLDLLAPAALRGGLLYESRITISARAELKDARIVLARGWNEGLTINTIEPSPIGEASADGLLSLDLGHVPAGKQYVLYLQFQVNPTTLGRRSQDVELYDGDERLLTRTHSMIVFP